MEEMENKTFEENTEAQDNGTETLDYTPNDDNFPQESDDDTKGKLALALMGLGAVGIGYGVSKLVSKIKKPKEESAENPAEEKPKKKGKETKIKGDKLTLKEKIIGYRLDPAPQEETPAEEAEEEKKETPNKKKGK